MDAAPSSPGHVDRAHSQDRLFAALTSGNQPRMAAVLGPAGIGKSTLLAHLMAQARQRDWRVAVGVAGEWDGAPPLWPLYEALSNVDPHQRVVASGLDAEPSLPGQEKAELFRNVANWLVQAADQQRTLLVIEDLHFADQTTVELISYLSRRPLPAELCIVVTCRPGIDQVEALRCPQILLDGFDPAQTQLLAQALGNELDDLAAHSLVERTGGNPLFLQRLMEQGLLQDGGDIPRDVSQLLERRLDAVAASELAALEILAVVGTATSGGLLRRIVKLDRADAAVTLPTNDIIRNARDHVSFRHGLFKELVYSRMTAERRAHLHALAAQALKSTGAGPALLAFHLAQAAEFDSGPEAASYATQAGQLALTIGALPEAVAQFRMATGVRRSLGDAGGLALALLDEARALGHMGRAIDGEVCIAEAIEVGDTLGPDIQQRIIREYGRLRWREEPNPSALSADRLRDLAQRWLGEHNDHASAAVRHTAYVSAADIRGMTADVLPHANAAVAAAETAGEPTLLGEAHLARRRALMVHHNSIEDRSADAEAASAAGRAAGDAELLGRAQRLEVCDALALADRTRVLSFIGASDDVPSTALREHEALWRATVAMAEGRYAQADEILDLGSKELSYLGVEAPALDFVRAVAAWDHGEFLASLIEFEPLLAVFADPILQVALALGKAIDGDHEGAEALVSAALEAVLGDEITVLWPLAAIILGEAAAAVDHHACQRIYDRLAPYAGICAVPAAAGVAWLGSFDRVLGLLCLRLGRIEAAVQHLGDSMDIHDRMGARPWVARSKAALAAALALSGDHQTAAALHDEARQLREDLGMGDVLLVGDFGVRPGSAGAGNGGRTAAGGSTARGGIFRRDGDVWMVGLDGKQHLVKHTSGMDYVSHLLERPGTDWHVLDLYATVSGQVVAGQGHGGEVLDDAARGAYQARYQALRETLDEAEGNDDAGRVEVVKVEMAMLEEELLSGFGLGGRARRMDDPTEKARINVRRSLMRAIDRIDAESAVLGDHLRRRIDTGRFCRYNPDPTRPVAWER